MRTDGGERCDLLTPLAYSGLHGWIFDLRSAKTRCATVRLFMGLESRAVVLTDCERPSTHRYATSVSVTDCTSGTYTRSHGVVTRGRPSRC